MRHATIIGNKAGKFQSIATGNAQEIREQYKHNNFAGYSQVYYLDTSGGVRRKKGTPAAARPSQRRKSDDLVA